MSHDLESGFYEGGWMFGPNNFCSNHICTMHEEINLLTYYFLPSSEQDIEWLLRTLMRYEDIINQYM